VVLAPGLPGQKARIKLMVVLGLTSDRDTIRQLFEDDGAA
jgi:L-asparaginase/Glu-tRNA(Gln) amidotransferase subunit D